MYKLPPSEYWYQSIHIANIKCIHCPNPEAKYEHVNWMSHVLYWFIYMFFKWTIIVSISLINYKYNHFGSCIHNTHLEWFLLRLIIVLMYCRNHQCVYHSETFHFYLFLSSLLQCALFLLNNGYSQSLFICLNLCLSQLLTSNIPSLITFRVYLMMFKRFLVYPLKLLENWKSW